MDNFTTLNQEINTQGILIITLNRPEKLNALNATMLEELSQLFDKAEKNNNIKALLITGSGKAFCAGADIKQLAEADANSGFLFATQGQRVFRQLEQLSKPSLAAINGYAFGGGCELAMACTLRIAAVAAKFGQPEVKLGVIPGYGGTQRLTRLIGKGRALDLCISGRTIDAELAYQWGLITEVVPNEQLLKRATEILQTLCALAPKAIQHTMKVIDQGFDLPLDEALHLEALHFALCCATQDKQEGVNAFLEKRSAIFKGE